MAIERLIAGKQYAVIILQWMIAIATSFLILFPICSPGSGGLSERIEGTGLELFIVRTILSPTRGPLGPRAKRGKAPPSWFTCPFQRRPWVCESSG